MKNFVRAVRLALRHRWTFAGAVSCALLVAVFWGANLSVVYPFVEVIFRGQSAPHWIDEEIATGADAVRSFEQRLAEVEAELAQAAPDEELVELKRQQSQLEMRLAAERKVLTRNQWLRPYLHEYMPHDPFRMLVLILVFLMTGTMLKAAFISIGSVLVARLSERAAFDLRVQFYRQVLHCDLVTMGKSDHGDLMNRFTANMGQVVNGLAILFGRAVREPLKMMACLIGAALICWRLLLLSLIVAPLMVWAIRSLLRSLKRANRRAMEEMSQIYRALSETISGIKVVKAFTMERYEMRRFQQTARGYYGRAMKIARYNSMVSPLNELTGICIISLAILAGAYLTLYQETHLGPLKMSDRPLPVAALLMFYAMMAGLSDPGRKLSNVVGSLQQAAAASDRIYEVIDSQSQIVESKTPADLPRHQQEICFDRIHFSYLDDQRVLSDISLTIPAGETLAIVGPNGCGKSTLAGLVCRFFDPTEGRVTIDGVDIRGVRLRDLRKQIGLVSQETVLFDDTVYNNIRYGAPRSRAEEIEGAARRAHAHEFIQNQLEEGYETMVGAGGCRLSGGQRQRIALARAILRDPPILILDEATSQIDADSERLIQDVLQEFTRDRTTFMITHRASSLSLADRIAVLDQGRLIDVGRHDELIARCEFYRSMNRAELKVSA